MTRIILATLLCGLFAGHAGAQDLVETDYVEMPELEPDYTVEGGLGHEVAIAGNHVLVTAPSAFGRDGALFAFHLTNDGLLQFRQRLVPSESTYQLGNNSLAADGNHAVVGATGSVLYFFTRNGDTWQQTQRLATADVPEPPGIDIRGLGTDMAMSGDLLAISDASARVQYGGSEINAAGAVMLYRRGGNGQWALEAIVSSPTPAASARFGNAVAVSGNTLLVGAVGENKAYVFERAGGQWQFVKSLQSPGNGNFGWSVALSGDLAVVGQRSGTLLPGPTNKGSIHTYERNLGGTGQWGLRGEYLSSQAGYIDNFSISLALRGKVLLVGASGGNFASFFVHRDGSGWEEVAVLDLDETDHDHFNPKFGISVAFSGLRAVIGASSFPDVDVLPGGGNERWGSVHVWTDISGGGCDNPLDGIYCDGFEGGGD